MPPPKSFLIDDWGNWRLNFNDGQSEHFKSAKDRFKRHAPMPPTEDLSEMYRIESDPDVKRYLNGPTRVPREEWIRGVESKLSRCQTLAVLAKDTGQFAIRAALDQYLDSDYLDAEVTREIQVVISQDYRPTFRPRGLQNSDSCRI